MGLDRRVCVCMCVCVSLKYCVVRTGALQEREIMKRERDVEADGFQNSIF